MTRLSSPSFSGTFKFDFSQMHQRSLLWPTMKEDLKKTTAEVGGYFPYSDFGGDIVVDSEHDSKIFPYIQRCIDHLKANPWDNIKVMYTHDDVKGFLQNFISKNRCNESDMSLPEPSPEPNSPFQLALVNMANILNSNLRYLNWSTQVDSGQGKIVALY